MPKISFNTLGCKLNFTETATISRQFIENGYEPTKFGQESDIVIINTCTVTAQAERKSKFAVKKALKDCPNAKVIVIGCASQISAKKFANISERVLVVGTEKKFDLLNIINNNQQVYSCDIAEINSFDFAYSISERTRSFLKIQDGCDYPCTYCTIPAARGKSRNAPIADIVQKANIIAQNGQKEIVLTGVNIGDFGKTTNQKFIDLLKELDKVQRIERYRISSIEPNLLKTEIIDFVANSQKFMPHFHIPLQSGSDTILKLMKRRYNTDLFRKKILEIHKKIPNVFLGIDVIVGFPGETNELFEQTYNLLNTLPIAYLHVFPYSDRPNTIASAIKNKVASEEIHRRVRLLEQLSNKKHCQFINNFKNSYTKVLFESRTKQGKMFGFTENYIKISVPFAPCLINQIANVQIINTFEDYAEGKII